MYAVVLFIVTIRIKKGKTTWLQKKNKIGYGINKMV